jgi:hypothetical protein
MSSLESHTIMDGKVHLYRRENSRKWQCAVYLGGRNHRASTKQENLAIAIEFARDWYMERYADERLRRRGVTFQTPIILIVSLLSLTLGRRQL